MLASPTQDSSLRNAMPVVLCKPENAQPGFAPVVSGARSYSPELGRWVNRDPIGEDGGANVTGFVGNNPVERFDLLALSFPLLRRHPVSRHSRGRGRIAVAMVHAE